ncbi:hypothetical protein ND856_06365 [Leptospira bandrabouensis]|uniref:HD domain-containing protein n=1 Tax=Leptospira bandrabouensis TaxID=2484903 RepID=UPI00223D76A6|nr:hypothetical protein [Leptospira bandrabouensis]MCW7458239.1 hypothetical protein [Leptospira bandrabouensis]MCW7476901.1 hypothetical protein [Leptospira bandrabouensis]MCW7484583.1 hypothetical protein [Leptospira bandrabouensis]
MNIQRECKGRFVYLLSNYSYSNQTVSDTLWEEIETRYSEPHCAYHNLNHLYQMLGEFEKVEAQLEDSEMVLFALYYHDLVYDPKSKTNEEERLLDLEIRKERINLCLDHILATKSHRLGDNSNTDTKYFLVMNLSILGSEENQYLEYTKNIRKEYSNYSDEDYRKGRIQVLDHFSETIRLYQTGYFFDQYEMRSRYNVKTEIHSLQKR